MEENILNQINGSIEVKRMIITSGEIIKNIERTCAVVISAYKNNNKTLIAGNGGSAADAQHMAAEFVSRFNFDRPALPSIALTTDTSILTAIGNDYGFDRVFARQIEANGNKGDVFIGISTSGKSKNIIEALKTCKDKGIITVGMTRMDGGDMEPLCDHCIRVPSMETPRIQECHELIVHIICAVVEEELFGKDRK